MGDNGRVGVSVMGRKGEEEFDAHTINVLGRRDLHAPRAMD